METRQTLGSFINRYIRDHGITINELSRKTKIAHSTLDRWIDGKSIPTLKQLNVLANFTETDICYLVDIVLPNGRREFNRGAISPDISRLAEQISHLSVPAQELIDSLILGLSIKSNKQNTDISEVSGREGS